MSYLIFQTYTFIFKLAFIFNLFCAKALTHASTYFPQSRQILTFQHFLFQNFVVTLSDDSSTEQPVNLLKEDQYKEKYFAQVRSHIVYNTNRYTPKIKILATFWVFWKSGETWLKSKRVNLTFCRRNVKELTFGFRPIFAPFNNSTNGKNCKKGKPIFQNHLQRY